MLIGKFHEQLIDKSPISPLGNSSKQILTQKHITKSVQRFKSNKLQKQQINSKNNRYHFRHQTTMKQPNEDNRTRKKQQPQLQTNPQLRPRLSNQSVSSQVSFNADPKKQKSKSFNRHQANTQDQQSQIVTIYRELQYTPEIRNVLKKFCYLDKEKLLKLSVNQLRQLCQKQLKRIDLLRRNSVHIQRLISEEEIDQTDNELSLIVISTQVSALVQFRNELKSSEGVTEASAKTRLRQHEKILLQIEKNDELIKNFINSHLKLPEPSDISIPDCKKFFKKQAQSMSQSSDRLILSRKTLCEIIIFLCRLLEGEILAFEDIYEYQEESVNSIEFGEDYNKFVVQSKRVRNNEVIVQNLDQSFSDEQSQESRKSVNNGMQKGRNGKTYQSYSNDDLGKKVNELAGICEQIPQLQAFTRTLKFSKITLQNRQSFFKIVDVIIALHHKIGYLSRNKPTLLKEIEYIESDLSEVYQTVREFVVLLTSDVPQFGELRFRSEEDAKHQLTEIISYLKKDMRKLAEIVRQQNLTERELFERLELLRAVVQTFCQTISEGDETTWQEYCSKLMSKAIGEEQRQIVNWLAECYTTIFTQLRSSIKNQQDIQTQKNLQAEVHTLLTDYQRLRGQHQELQANYNSLLDHKQQLVFDIEERDKIIGNLTSIKISSEKREKSLRDQLIEAQEDAGRFEQDLGLLQEELEMMSIQNQNKLNDMVYEHQTEVKELVDKITMLQRDKLSLLGKCEDERNKSVRLLQDGNYSSVQMQTLRDRLQKKIKQHDENSKKQKELINSLEKDLQQAKNDKSLLESKCELAQKNQNKLMQRLQQLSSKYSHNVKDFEDKYEEQLIVLKQANYKLQKQLQKHKRNNALLSDQIQQLKHENTTHAKTSNQYRMKLIQLNPIQNEYDSLLKEYDRVVDSFHKLQANHQTLKSKLFQLTNKHQELLELMAKEKEVNRRLEKKCKDQDHKLEEIVNSYEGNDIDLKQQQKLSKMLHKKITELQQQVDSLQQSLTTKDKTHSLAINRSQTKYQQISSELQQQINQLKGDNSSLEEQNAKLMNELKLQEKQLKQQISDTQHGEIEWQQKQKEWTKIRTQMEKKLGEKEQQRLQLEKQRLQIDKQREEWEQQRLELGEKLRVMEEQLYSQSVLLQEIKEQKGLYQLKVSEMQAGEKSEMSRLKSGISQLQQSQSSLKLKVSKLQSELQGLSGEIDQLKKIIQQKDNELQKSEQQGQRKLKQKQTEEEEKIQREYESRKSEELTQLREQIIIEKNVIMTENRKLHEENNSLQGEIDKLKALNDALEKNVNKLHSTSTQAKQDLAKEQSTFKLTITKHLFTITSLENQLTSVNAERQLLAKDYEQLKDKLQAKSKALAEKDNLLFQRQLQKNNLQKTTKELKFKLTQLQNTIETLNSTVDKMKNNKIRTLEQQLTSLNGLLQEYKKKQQLSRISLNDLQQQMEKLKRDHSKKIQHLKEQHTELYQQYQSQTKKIHSQHALDLSSLEHNTRKDTQNQFNQLLIKEKQTFNNLTIQKMEELGQMQRKYQKLIRDQKNDKNSLQEQCNKLERQLNELKRKQSVNDSRILQEEEEQNAIEQLQKLKSQHQTLKREHSRIQHQANRLSSQCASTRQQNSTLSSKLLESQHSVTILTSKLNLLSQNLQNTKKSLDQMHKLQLQKLNLQRQLDRVKARAVTDETRVNDYRLRVEEMEQRVGELEGKLQLCRNKEFQWTRNNDQSAERFRALNSQSNDMSLKLQQMKLKLSQITNKLTQKTHQLQSIQSKLSSVQRQLHTTQQKYKQKQIQLTSTKHLLTQQITILQQQLTKKANTNIVLQREKKQLLNQSQLKHDELALNLQTKVNKLRQLQLELNQYKRNANQGDRMIEQLTRVRNQKMTVEDKCTRLELQLARLKTDKLTLESHYDILSNQLTEATNQRNRLLTEVRDLHHNLTLFKQQITLFKQQNQHLSRQSQQLIAQMKKLKQLSSAQLKSLKDQLLKQAQNQTKSLQSHFQQSAKHTNLQLSRQRQKHSDLSLKSNRMLQQMDQQQKMLQTLRKQNMQLSDHCQKYEQRIRVLEERNHQLESEHMLKGQSALQIQTQCKHLQVQIYKLNETHNRLMADCEKLSGDKLLLKQKIQSLNSDNIVMRQKVAQLQAELDTSIASRQQLERRLDQLNAALDKKTCLLNDLELKLQTTSNSLHSLQQQHNNLQQTLTSSQTQTHHLQQAIASYQQTAHSSNSELSHLKAQNLQLTLSLSQNAKLINTLNHNSTNSQLKLAQTTAKLTSTSDQLQSMRNQNNLLLDKLNTYEKQLKLLANQFATLQQRLRQAEGYIQWSDNQRKGLEERLALLLKELDNLSLEKQHLQQRLSSMSTQLQTAQNQTKSLQSTIFQAQGEKNKKDYETKQLSAQNQNLSRQLTQLQEHLKQLENQHKLNESNKATQECGEIQRLEGQLALTRQELVRVNDVIKRKQEDFEREIVRLTEEKGQMWKENQLLAQQCQSLKVKLDQMQRLSQNKAREIQDLKQDKLKLLTQLDQLKRQLAHSSRQLAQLNQQLADSHKKQQQLLKSATQLQRDQHELLRAITDLQTKNKEQSLLINQLRQKEHELQRNLADTQLKEQELARTLANQEHQLRKLSQQNQTNINKDQTIINISKQLEDLKNESGTTSVISSTMRQDLDKAYQEINHLKSVIARLQSDNQNLNSHLVAKQRIINEMRQNVHKGNELMENADKELKKTFQQKHKQNQIIRQLATQKDYLNHTIRQLTQQRDTLSQTIRQLTQQKDNLTQSIRQLSQQRESYSQNIRQLTQQRDSYSQIIKMRQSQTATLKQTISILQQKINEQTVEIHRLIQSDNSHSLSQSRSNINLITKSYSYQGGQVTSAEFARFEEQNRRLIKEIQSRDKTIAHQQFQIQKLYKQIKILKEQIHLLSQGKTISLKGYTRVTNPNDTTLNTKGTIYTEYDVKQMKAKIELLEKSLSRYQDRETQLLRQIQKYKFRQRHFTQQIRAFQENAKAQKLKQPDSVKQIPSNSPQKKTAFDQDYNNRQNQPQSSTYRIQTGIEVTQRSINMTKKQVKTTEKYFVRVQAEELRKIIERLTNGQQIVNSKIDEILNTAQRTNKESLELVLTNNQFNLTPVIINEIRELIHQNKALVETLKSMKQFKEDVSLLIQEYIDPELLTEFVYRILTYFSQVSDQSAQAKEIRNELNMIRKNNVGGFYFTVLEEYTKYILENNSIEIYKEELRQKARELISFRQKFQSIIDSKLDENEKLLNRSDSKNSFLHRSRTKYMGSSRMGSSRGKSECSELSHDDNSRVREMVPAENSSNANRVSMPVGQNNVLPNPIHLLTGAGHSGYSMNQQNYMPNIALSPGLITAQRSRASSTLTYTPYNKQIVQQSNTPTQSINDSRAHVSYSTTSTSHFANSYTTVNSSNANNFMKPAIERKL